MNKYIEHAISDYENAVATLAKFCAEFGLKCHLESNTVKKLFNLCAAVGEAYLHSYKAQEELRNE